MGAEHIVRPERRAETWAERQLEEAWLGRQKRPKRKPKSH